MSTTILTPEQIDAIRDDLVENWFPHDKPWQVFSRAIEAAILQSPEVQAWKLDADRLREVLKEAASELDCLGSELERIHRENPSIVATLPASNVLSMVRDTAMERKT